MIFELVSYKKSFVIFRSIVLLVFLMVLVDVLFIKFFINEKDGSYYIAVSLLLISFKLYYYCNEYYSKVGVLSVDRDSIKLNDNDLKDCAVIYYFGYEGMNKWIYIPLIVFLFFYWPKSRKGPIYDGINVLKVGGEKFYFLSESKDDYSNLKEVVKDKQNIKLVKCYL